MSEPAYHLLALPAIAAKATDGGPAVSTAVAAAVERRRAAATLGWCGECGARNRSIPEPTSVATPMLLLAHTARCEADFMSLLVAEHAVDYVGYEAVRVRSNGSTDVSWLAAPVALPAGFAHVRGAIPDEPVVWPAEVRW